MTLAVGLAILGGLSLVGGIIGNSAYFNDKKKEEENYKLEQQKLDDKKTLENDEYKKLYGGKLSDGTTVEGLKNKEYNLNKAEAFKQAEISDKKTTLQEGYLGSEYNNALAQLGLAQKSQGLENEATSLNIASETGSSLASQATSGTRGSSVMGAIERSQAYNESTFAENRNIAQMNLNQQLNSYILGMNQSKDNITLNRADANKQRNDWLAGGYNYNQFQLQKESASNSLSSAIKQIDLQKSYNKTYYDNNKLNSSDHWSYVFKGATGGIDLFSAGKNLINSF